MSKTQRKVDPRKQFSKKLASRVEWFWFLYMLLLVFAIVITPDSALPAVYLGIMATGVMLLSIYDYTKNSLGEKGFYWLAEITKAIANTKAQTKDSEEKTESESEEDSEEEGGNG